MAINLSAPAITELKPHICVVGVGGAGGNAVNNMIGGELEGVDFVAANTDSQALSLSLTERRIQMGINVTQGLGAGSNPDMGRQAAEESMSEILEAMAGCHMVFITAGMGGGTGTGAAPVIARAAREAGILTVGVATKPFQFEGAHRMAIAEAGLKEFEAHVDTLIVIPNQNLFRIANEKTTFAEAFAMADDVLYSGVRGVTDLMVMPGLINLDFADVRAAMMEMGKAMMGTGEAEGEDRAIAAAEAAISNPLLDEVSMKGARGVLVNITGGRDLTLYEVDEATKRISDEVDADANIIFGAIIDESIEGKIRVSVVATGIDAEESIHTHPQVHTLYPGVPAAGGQTTVAPEITQSAFALPTGGGSMAPVAMGGGGAAAAAMIVEPMLEDPFIEEQDVGVATPVAAPVSKTDADPATARSDDAAKVDVSPAAVPFIPPQPVQPAARRAPLRKPDPFAEAAVANAKPKGPTKTARRLSLLDRMGFRNRDAEKTVEPTLATPQKAEMPVQPEPAIEPTPELPEASAATVRSAPSQTDPAPVVEESAAERAPTSETAPASAAAPVAETAPVAESAMPEPTPTPVPTSAPTMTAAPEVTAPSVTATAAPTPPVAASSLPAATPTPTPAPEVEASTTETPASDLAPEPDEDLLDIPAFLRRQAN